MKGHAFSEERRLIYCPAPRAQIPFDFHKLGVRRIGGLLYRDHGVTHGEESSSADETGDGASGVVMSPKLSAVELAVDGYAYKSAVTVPMDDVGLHTVPVFQTSGTAAATTSEAVAGSSTGGIGGWGSSSGRAHASAGSGGGGGGSGSALPSLSGLFGGSSTGTAQHRSQRQVDANANANPITALVATVELCEDGTRTLTVHSRLVLRNRMGVPIEVQLIQLDTAGCVSGASGASGGGDRGGAQDSPPLSASWKLVPEETLYVPVMYVHANTRVRVRPLSSGRRTTVWAPVLVKLAHADWSLMHAAAQSTAPSAHGHGNNGAQYASAARGHTHRALSVGVARVALDSERGVRFLHGMQGGETTERLWACMADMRVTPLDQLVRAPVSSPADDHSLCVLDGSSSAKNTSSESSGGTGGTSGPPPQPRPDSDTPDSDGVTFYSYSDASTGTVSLTSKQPETRTFKDLAASILHGTKMRRASGGDPLPPLVAVSLRPPLVLHNLTAEPFAYQIVEAAAGGSGGGVGGGGAGAQARHGPRAGAAGVLPVGAALPLFDVDVNTKLLLLVRLTNYEWSKPVKIHDHHSMHPLRETILTAVVKAPRPPPPPLSSSSSGTLSGASASLSAMVGVRAKTNRLAPSLQLQVSLKGRHVRVFSRVWVLNRTAMPLQYRDYHVNVGEAVSKAVTIEQPGSLSLARAGDGDGHSDGRGDGGRSAEHDARPAIPDKASTSTPAASASASSAVPTPTTAAAAAMVPPPPAPVMAPVMAPAPPHLPHLVAAAGPSADSARSNTELRKSLGAKLFQRLGRDELTRRNILVAPQVRQLTVRLPTNRRDCVRLNVPSDSQLVELFAQVQLVAFGGYSGGGADDSAASDVENGPTAAAASQSDGAPSSTTASSYPDSTVAAAGGGGGGAGGGSGVMLDTKSFFFAYDDGDDSFDAVQEARRHLHHSGYADSHGEIPVNPATRPRSAHPTAPSSTHHSSAAVAAAVAASRAPAAASSAGEPAGGDSDGGAQTGPGSGLFSKGRCSRLNLTMRVDALASPKLRLCHAMEELLAHQDAILETPGYCPGSGPAPRGVAKVELHERFKTYALPWSEAIMFDPPRSMLGGAAAVASGSMSSIAGPHLCARVVCNVGNGAQNHERDGGSGGGSGSSSGGGSGSAGAVASEWSTGVNVLSQKAQATVISLRSVEQTASNSKHSKETKDRAGSGSGSGTVLGATGSAASGLSGGSGSGFGLSSADAAAAAAAFDRRRFELGLRVQDGKGVFWRTSVLTFAPRYILTNRLGRALEVAQAAGAAAAQHNHGHGHGQATGERGASLSHGQVSPTDAASPSASCASYSAAGALKLQPGESCIFHWPHHDRPLALRIRFALNRDEPPLVSASASAREGRSRSAGSTSSTGSNAGNTMGYDGSNAMGSSGHHPIYGEAVDTSDSWLWSGEFRLDLLGVTPVKLRRAGTNVNFRVSQCSALFAIHACHLSSTWTHGCASRGPSSTARLDMPRSVCAAVLARDDHIESSFRSPITDPCDTCDIPAAPWDGTFGMAPVGCSTRAHTLGRLASCARASQRSPRERAWCARSSRRTAHGRPIGSRTERHTRSASSSSQAPRSRQVSLARQWQRREQPQRRRCSSQVAVVALPEGGRWAAVSEEAGEEGA